MKKLLLFCALMVFVPAWRSFAQGSRNMPSPTIRFGNITPSYINGQQSPINTTREEVLANPKLIIEPEPCKVLSFTFGMHPKGHDYIGPFNVKGANLTPEIIKLLQELDDPQGRIFIENVKILAGDNTMRNCNTIILNLAANK